MGVPLTPFRIYHYFGRLPNNLRLVFTYRNPGTAYLSSYLHSQRVPAAWKAASAGAQFELAARSAVRAAEAYLACRRGVYTILLRWPLAKKTDAEIENLALTDAEIDHFVLHSLAPLAVQWIEERVYLECSGPSGRGAHGLRLNHTAIPDVLKYRSQHTLSLYLSLFGVVCGAAVLRAAVLVGAPGCGRDRRSRPRDRRRARQRRAQRAARARVHRRARPARGAGPPSDRRRERYRRVAQQRLLPRRVRAHAAALPRRVLTRRPDAL